MLTNLRVRKIVFLVLVGILVFVLVGIIFLTALARLVIHGLSMPVTTQPGISAVSVCASTDRGKTPLGASYSSMVYDPASGQLVVFGGMSTRNRILNGTWILDGDHWHCFYSPAGPSARYQASMAYDATTRSVVLFGGEGRYGKPLNGTWIWNGHTWLHTNPPSSPSARYGATMAYDPATSQLVLSGGQNASGTIFNDTWIWDGRTWKRMHQPGSSPTTVFSSIAYDTTTRQLILIGGIRSYSLRRNPFNLSVWYWNGLHWQNGSLPYSSQACNTTIYPGCKYWSPPQPLIPPVRYAGSIAYMPNGTVLLWGGMGKSLINPLSDTWVLVDNHWNRMSTVVHPPGLYAAEAAYDPAYHGVILFGGVQGINYDSSINSEFWLWNGSKWQILHFPA